MSNIPLFCVYDPTELMALWRLIAEAKFQQNPDDKDLWGSPYVHELTQRVSDSLLQHYRSSGDEQSVSAHKRWVASLPENVAMRVVKEQLKRDASSQWWHIQTRDEKLAYVRGCVAPFELTAQLLSSLIHDAEA